jgi:hypothetical protein
MANYIDNNRNTWFSLNEEIKRGNNKPIETGKNSLLQRKESKSEEQMMSTKRYMMTIRNAFKRHMPEKGDV